jgi:Ca2+/Na+ antiporter
LGSNIVNVCLILGLCFIMAALKNSNYTQHSFQQWRRRM